MDMQMFKQELMEAQAIGDIYKNELKKYCMCVWRTLKGDRLVEMRSFALVSSQTVHGVKAFVFGKQAAPVVSVKSILYGYFSHQKVNKKHR